MSTIQSLPVYDATVERERNTIGEKIAASRRASGMTLSEAANALLNFGIQITSKNLSQWENGKSVPNAYQLISLCLLFGVTNVNELSNRHGFELNDIGLQKVDSYKRDLIASGLYTPSKPVRMSAKYKQMPISYLKASAGTGQWLDDDAFEHQLFPEDNVPSDADFGVIISGDSMEPVLYDGEIAWIKKTEELRSGEVGLFVCDGQGFVKIYNIHNRSRRNLTKDNLEDHYYPKVTLNSFNEKYPPIVITEDTILRICGRVIQT